MTNVTNLVRELGYLERVYDLWRRENALSFCVVAELDGAVTLEELRSAIGVVQQRHPLLAVTVEDTAEDVVSRAPVFVHVDEPVEVRAHQGVSWPQMVGEELARAFPRQPRPLARVVLVDTDTLIFTFEHTIADGLSAATIAQETVAVLNGHPLLPLPIPAAQHELVQKLPPPPAAREAAAEAADPRLLVPGVFEFADTGEPFVSTVTWSREETDELVRRCRAENTTVTGALAAAEATVLASATPPGYLRVSVPYALEHLVGDSEGFSVNIGKVSIGWPAQDLENLWQAACFATRTIHRVRERPAVDESVAGLTQLWNSGLDRATVMDALVVANSFELMITNIGRLEPTEDTGPLRIRALWGPILLNQQQGQQIVGACTWRGRLRLATATRAKTDLLEQVRELLLRA
jgi:hypothetical protein